MKLFSKIIPFCLMVGFSFLSIFSVRNVEADCLNKMDAYGYQACAESINFSDTNNHQYLEAVKYAQRNRIVKGYADGTFKPDSPINRAEFTKILVEAVLEETPPTPTTACFPDVESGIWFEAYVCYGKDKLFNGYPDGTFGPVNNINFAEAAKILSNTYKLSIGNEVVGEKWYGKYIDSLEKNKVIPGTIQTSFHLITRGEMVEMIMRLTEDIQNKASLSACDFVPERCESTSFSGYGDDFQPSGVDMQKVRIAWLAWYNGVRNEAGLHNYRYNNGLNKSAYVWSEFSKDRGEISHKRIGQTEYYDYNMIKNWFGTLGLEFENVNTVTFTENIGWGPFNCSDNDCTNALIESVRSTFDFYMAEKNKSYRPHYNSVMNEYFNEIGLGIVIDQEANKYYLTVHYGTKLI